MSFRSEYLVCVDVNHETNMNVGGLRRAPDSDRNIYGLVKIYSNWDISNIFINLSICYMENSSFSIQTAYFIW